MHTSCYLSRSQRSIDRVGSEGYDKLGQLNVEQLWNYSVKSRAEVHEQDPGICMVESRCFRTW